MELWAIQSPQHNLVMFFKQLSAFNINVAYYCCNQMAEVKENYIFV